MPEVSTVAIHGPPSTRRARSPCRAAALLLTLTTGLGLRQGEVFGLAVEDVDFLRQVVRVQRQVVIVGNRLVFALPKGRKVREVPLPSSVANALSAHLQADPARVVALPWEVRGRQAGQRLTLPDQSGRRSPQPERHRPLGLEARPAGGEARRRPGAGDARRTARLRERAARRWDERPRAGGVPGPRRPRLHAEDLDASPAAGRGQGKAGR